MKKIILSIVLFVLSCSMSFAQSDGFFSNWNDFENRDGSYDFPTAPPHGNEGDQPGAPLGSGLLILTALGAGYAVTKKVKSRK